MYIGAKRKIMSDMERDIRDLENRFSAASGSAFAAAREQTFASGQSVLQSEQGEIYEVFPDGTRKRVKNIEPPTPIKRGARLTIR
jgi:hypothetical protein